jgi:hypothetical protein
MPHNTSHLPSADAFESALQDAQGCILSVSQMLSLARTRPILPDNVAKVVVLESTKLLCKSVVDGWKTIEPLLQPLAAAANGLICAGPMTTASAHQAVLLITSDMLQEIFVEACPNWNEELMRAVQKVEGHVHAVIAQCFDPGTVLVEGVWSKVASRIRAYEIYEAYLGGLRAACEQESARALQAASIRASEFEANPATHESAGQSRVPAMESEMLAEGDPLLAAGSNKSPENNRRKKGPFDLIIDESCRSVTRGGQTAKFEGRNLPWCIFLQLGRSAGKGLPASRLSRLNGYVVLR